MLLSLRNIGILAIQLFFLSLSAGAQTLSLVSGDGQIVLENFRSTSPLVVRATDAQGRPMAGVPITWQIRDAPGGLIAKDSVTGADGAAQAFFVAATIDPGLSIVPLRVAAGSPFGEVVFRITTAIVKVSGGAPAVPPLVEVLSPSLIAPPFSGPPGTVFPDAVRIQVVVQSGTQLGAMIPNVGVRIIPIDNIFGTPAATCRAPGGVVLTGADGIAHCDLVLGNKTGSFRLAAYVGEMAITHQIRVEITAPGGGGGTPPPAALTITTGNTLPTARAGAAYSTAFQASGGQQPYQWSATGTLPDGLSLNPSTGLLSGTPTTAASAQFTIQVRDNLGATARKMFTLLVTNITAPPNGLVISNLSFANGRVGQRYFAAVLTSGGCVSPFNPARLSLSDGALPPGLTLTRAAIEGTPTQAGVFEFVLTAQDVCGAGVHRSFAITIATAGGSLPAPTLVAEPSSIVFQAVAGGNPPAPVTVQVSASSASSFTAAASTQSGGDWLQVAPGQGQTPATVSIGVANLAALSAGTYAGHVTLAPATPGQPPTQISVSLEIQAGAELLISPTSLSFEVRPGTPPPTQQTISISSTPASIAYDLQVTTQDGRGWLFATPTVTVTPANVFVAINAFGLEPGLYHGRIVIRPNGVQANPAEIAVTLEIPQPDPAILAITNGASFRQGPISPGEIVVLFGTGIGPRDLTPLTVEANGRLSTTIASTRVLFGDTPAPLIYAWRRQVAAIVPYDAVPGGAAGVRVEYNGKLSPPVSVKVVAASPAIFTAGASSQGAVLNQDNSPNSVDRPAEPGEIISIFATGEGQTDPPGQDGKLAAGVLPKPLLPVDVFIGGVAAEVLYAGGAPTLPAGVIQVNARIPKSTPAGPVEILLRVGSFDSPPGVLIQVRPKPPGG